MTTKTVEGEAAGLGSILLVVAPGVNVIKTLDAADAAPLRLDHEGIAFELFVRNSDGPSYYRPVEPLTEAQRKTLLALSVKTDAAAIQAKAEADLAAIQAKADADLLAIKAKTGSIPEPKAEPKAEPKRDSRY